MQFSLEERYEADKRAGSLSAFFEDYRCGPIVWNPGDKTPRVVVMYPALDDLLMERGKLELRHQDGAYPVVREWAGQKIRLIRATLMVNNRVLITYRRVGSLLDYVSSYGCPLDDLRCRCPLDRQHSSTGGRVSTAAIR